MFSIVLILVICVPLVATECNVKSNSECDDFCDLDANLYFVHGITLLGTTARFQCIGPHIQVSTCNSKIHTINQQEFDINASN